MYYLIIMKRERDHEIPQKSLLQGSLAEREHLKFPFQRLRLASRRNNINRERRVIPVVVERAGEGRAGWRKIQRGNIKRQGIMHVHITL